MKSTLSHPQAINFLSWVWNTQLKWSSATIWENIREFENSRSFSEGWPYCPSAETEGEDWEGMKKWWYTTTSGTTVTIHEDGATVEVADDRAQIGRTAWAHLQLALHDVLYQSWAEYYYGTSACSREIAAFWAAWQEGENIFDPAYGLEDLPDNLPHRRR